MYICLIPLKMHTETDSEGANEYSGALFKIDLIYTFNINFTFCRFCVCACVGFF